MVTATPELRGLEPLPASCVELPGGVAFLAREGARLRLVVPSEIAGFDGPLVAGGGDLRLVEPTPAAARRLGELVPWLAPTPLGAARSFGFGDRLGCATRGHVRALRRAGAGTAAVLAQQSARELRRTGRTLEDVVAAAVWGALQSGWQGGFGADADHLTTPDEVEAGVAAGCSMFTLDPRAHVAAAAVDASELAARVETLPWVELDDTAAASRRRHAASAFAGTRRPLVLDERAWALASVKYAHALVRLRSLAAGVPPGADLEVSFDETAEATTPEEHLYLARELERLDVRVTSFAPRFPGSWEKAVDFEGDLGELAEAAEEHAAVAAAHGGYKLSLHSGSDKHGAYATFAAATGGRLHVKTSGTSYLEALRLVARRDPELFREIAALAHERYADDRATYALTAVGDPDRVTATAADDLPGLLDDPEVRQVLHVTFGSVLTDASLGPRLRETVAGDAEEYWALLDAHFIRHLAPLGVR